MFRINFKIGNSSLSFENQDVKNIFKASELFAGLPRKCHNCNSDDIRLGFKSPKKNDFYLLTCNQCNAQLQFHQKKEGGFYVKWDEKMEVFQKDNSENNIPDVSEQSECPF